MFTFHVFHLRLFRAMKDMLRCLLTYVVLGGGGFLSVLAGNVEPEGLCAEQTVGVCQRCH